jgi:hypothetical protein
MIRSVRRDRAIASIGYEQVTADQGQVAGLDGRVGSGAHGQPQVSLGQGGGVVDAVARHGDDPAGVLQLLDHVDLPGGQHARDHLADADRGGDVPGGSLVVAGEQHRAQAQAAPVTRMRVSIPLGGMAEVSRAERGSFRAWGR